MMDARCCLRRPLVTVLLLLLVVALQLVTTAQAQQQQQYDCAAGCPLVASSSSAAVCGDDGLVYAGACLAVCAGARVVPCNKGGLAKAAAAAPSGSADSSSLSRLLDLSQASMFAALQQQQKRGGDGASAASASTASSTAATPSPPPAFTFADIQRYAEQGFALLGPARVDTFKPKPPTVLKGTLAAAAASGSSSSSSSSSDVRAVRFAADTGLLYATQRSVLSSSSTTNDVAAMAALLAAGGEAPKGWRPTSAASRSSAGGDSAAAAAALPAAANTTGPPVNQGAGMNDAAWTEIKSATAARAYPYSAVASLDIGDWGCSGSRIGKWSVLTAGHCVYDFGTATLQQASAMRVTMARFKGSNGRFSSPFRSVGVRSYTYFKDFAQGYDYKPEIYGLDMAVLQLAADPGNTGTLGLVTRDAPCGLARCVDDGNGGSTTPASTSPFPPSPPTCANETACTTVLDSAAYPGDSKQFGRFFRYRARSAGRATRDTDAQDGLITSQCTTPDSVAQPVLPRMEPGMSGSALWAVGVGSSSSGGGVAGSRPGTGTGAAKPPAFRVVGVLSGFEIDSYPDTGALTCTGAFWYTEMTERNFQMVVKAVADYDKAGRKAAAGGSQRGV